MAVGEPAGTLTYRWTANDDDGWNAEGRPDPATPGWFNHIDRGEVEWMAIRPSSSEEYPGEAYPNGVRLTCQATDANGPDVHRLVMPGALHTWVVRRGEMIENGCLGRWRQVRLPPRRSTDRSALAHF